MDKDYKKVFDDEYDEAIFKFTEDLFNRNQSIVSEAKGQFIRDYTNSEWDLQINLSSIETKIIQAAGRYCDNYASDILITRDSMMQYLEEKQKKVLDEYDYNYFVFAMRENGSDGKAYIYERAKQYSTSYLSAYYRKIFICKVECIKDEIHVIMKEIGSIDHINE